MLAEVTGDYYNSGEFKRNLASLDSKDRLLVMEKFTSYILPRMQSATVEAAVETRRTIEDRLLALSGGNE